MTRPSERGVPLKNLLAVRGLIDDAPLLAEAIVDTVREPLLLLDPDLKVVLANRSFYLTFKIAPEETLDRMFYELGNGQWNIPRLRALLEDIIPKNNCVFDYEVTHEFPGIRDKVMRLNASKLRRRQDQADLILLAIEDITALREGQQELERLLRQREVLVQEIHHRVKNNLQTIVSLLSLHAGYTDNVHAKSALAEAGERVQAIARLHERLYASDNLSEVNVGEYLRSLAEDLRNLHARPEIQFEVDTQDIVLDMERAAPLALLANELISNSLKHAFPEPPGGGGEVKLSIRYWPNRVHKGEPLDESLCLLEIQDNGVGFPAGLDAETSTSMGLRLVRLLTRQLQGSYECTVANGVRWAITFPLAGKTGGAG